MDIGSEDEELFDPKSIVNRIRCLSKKIRVSPQLRHTFESNVKVCYDLEPTPSSQSPTTLPASSPSTMRAYELKFAYDMFVNKAGDAHFKFKMSSDDWDNLRVVIALLNPLYLATLKLSKSKFPSLNETLPTYMGLTKVTFKHSSLIMWHIVV